jgi:hypothetical protein
MSNKSRGFQSIVGKTISKVDTTVINEVVLTDTDGSCYAIEAEQGPLGIPLIVLRNVVLSTKLLKND